MDIWFIFNLRGTWSKKLALKATGLCNTRSVAIIANNFAWKTTKNCQDLCCKWRIFHNFSYKHLDLTQPKCTIRKMDEESNKTQISIPENKNKKQNIIKSWVNTYIYQADKFPTQGQCHHGPPWQHTRAGCRVPGRCTHDARPQSAWKAGCTSARPVSEVWVGVLWCKGWQGERRLKG